MATLTASQRKQIKKSDFAIPEKAPGPGSYPIENIGHARDALARSSGKPVESRVRAAVHRKFPELDPKGQMDAARKAMRAKYPHMAVDSDNDNM